MFTYFSIRKSLGHLLKCGVSLSAIFSLSFAQAASIDDDAHYKALKNQHYQELKQKLKGPQQAQKFSLQKSVAQTNTVQIIVETADVAKSVTALNAVEAAAKLNGVSVRKKLERLHVLSLNVNEKQLDDLFADNKVKVLSEDKAVEPSLDVSVPYVGGKTLQDAGFKGAGQAVAIFDTGFDTSHPFLGGRIVEEACFSSGDQQTLFSLCPNGQNRQTGSGSAHDCSATYSGTDCMHGTHVAGIAAGANDYMTGMAPAANIVAVQIFTYDSLTGRLYAYTSDILAAYDWLLNESHTTHVAAINMSLGGGSYSSYCDDSVPALTTAIQTLRARGTATVISSGNDGFVGSVTWPGCISSAVTVGATYHNFDFITWFSNIAPMVDLVAPGLEINSSVPGGNYATMSGTSMAAPHVTGAFALLKSFKPDATVDQIEQALKQGGVTHPDYDFTIPRLDVVGASTILASDSCKTLPGDISNTATPLANNEEKSWSSFVPQGGLFRVWVSNAASSGSNSIRVTLNGTSVDISVAAGGSSLVDFANVNAGPMILTVKSLSSGFSLGHIWVEQIANNNTASSTGCAVPVPAILNNGVGAIALNAEKSWPINLVADGNVRALVTSSSSLQSRTLAVILDSTSVTISIDAAQTVQVDFAGLAKGIHQLSIKALSSDVSVGKFEAVNY